MSSDLVLTRCRQPVVCGALTRQGRTVISWWSIPQFTTVAQHSFLVSSAVSALFIITVTPSTPHHRSPSPKPFCCDISRRGVTGCWPLALYSTCRQISCRSTLRGECFRGDRGEREEQRVIKEDSPQKLHLKLQKPFIHSESGHSFFSIRLNDDRLSDTTQSLIGPNAANRYSNAHQQFGRSRQPT